MYQKQTQKQVSNNFQMEEGTIAEKTSYVENLNRLIAHINHVAVYRTQGDYVEGVKQLDAMLYAYKDDKFNSEFKLMEEEIKVQLKQYSLDDKHNWMEENSLEIARTLFKLLMGLMARSGLSPTGRIVGIDNAKE